MALTRAQLLMGDSSQGPVLAGQVQAVKAGSGISIDASGTITVNSQSVIGVMKLGQTAASAAAAYNSYEWPIAVGTPGQQITIQSVGGVASLAWGDPDQIPWTAKGQLVVGTGAGTQDLLNVGTNGQILIADSSTTTGLAYTGNYVATSGPTSAANIPAGAPALRPLTPPAGAFRYNSTTTRLEFYNGAAWESVASSGTNGFVEKTSDVGAALMPAGTQLQRPGVAAGGYMRFNDDTDKFEFFNGTSWVTMASSTSGSFVEQSVPTAPAGVTPSAEIPAGTTAQRQTGPAPLAGYTRFNTTINNLEFYDGTNWVISASASNLGLGLSTNSVYTVSKLPEAATPPTIGTGQTQAIIGSTYYDDNLGSMFVLYSNGGSPAWVAI